MPVHNWTRVPAGIFHDFHHEWISTIKRALNDGLLPPDYYALAEQIAGGLGPDVLALGSSQPPPTRRSGDNGAALALASAPPKVRFTAAAETEAYARKRKRIAIRHSSDDRVVAVVEIVSPGNKASRHAVRSFVDKAVELLDAGIHLLVVDLFPPSSYAPEGIHPAIWSELEEVDFQLPPEQPLTAVSYSAGPLKRAFIEPFGLRDPLPEMPLFLEPEYYVPVPLEEMYQSAYQAVPQRWRRELENA